jgi:outer membrane cobalamin receptor
MRAALAIVVVGLLAARAHAQEAEPDLSQMTDEELIELAEQGGETIVVWDERPEKPFDRDTELRLTGEELAARGATDLGTALALLPDVQVRDVGRGGFNIDIRGSRKGAVRVLIDGVAVSDPFYGTFDVSTIPITDIAEIRVSTSPASPIDGPGGPGGVVEVHTHDAIGTQLVIARATGSSLPIFGVSATGRTPLEDELALRLSASSSMGAEDLETASGATIDDRRRATTGAFRLEHRDGARRGVVDGFADDRRYVSPPSDELATALILLIDRETSGRLGVGYDDALGADQRLQIQVRGWAHALRRISRNFRDPELTDQVSKEHLTSIRGGAHALVTRPIGRLARWIGAVTIDHERARATTDSASGETIARGDVTMIEAAAGAQVEKDAVKADAAVGVAVPLGLDGASAWPEAKVSVAYAPRFVELEAIGARKGRVPSLRERFQGVEANEALDPEQAWHAELRVVGRPREGVELVVAPYWRRTTGTVKVGMDNLLVNLGELEVRGVDVSARAQLVEQVAVGGAYDYAKATSEDLGPDPLDRFPEHRVDAWVQVRPFARATLLARGRWIGEGIDRDVVTPSYMLWEVSATAEIGDGWLGVVRCDDLLDERPETRAGYHTPGRVISLIVQHTWD